MKAHYQEAMSELHYTPEMQLLELLPEALMDNSTQLEILKPFYTLCLSLLSTADVQTPAQLKATLRLHDHQRQKRCTNMKTVSWHRRNECRGMCGPKCTCWSLICGDCCYHQGCYEHDRCCDVKGFWHKYCLFPFMYSFGCSSYGAYPKCLNWNSALISFLSRHSSNLDWSIFVWFCLGFPIEEMTWMSVQQ